MTDATPQPVSPRVRLDGAAAIARYMNVRERWVYQARERGFSCPIRKREGLGLYAFADEIDDWLNSPETLPEAEQAA